jgi:hypothetical protein
MDDSVVEFPKPPEPPEILVGPFQEWRVVVDGKMIPRLTGFHDGDKIALVLDNRFSAYFPKEYALQVAWLIANALAIGEGYSNFKADTKDMPFAPTSMSVETPI